MASQDDYEAAIDTIQEYLLEPKKNEAEEVLKYMEMYADLQRLIGNVRYDLKMSSPHRGVGRTYKVLQGAYDEAVEGDSR
jgi:hypothetical protein